MKPTLQLAVAIALLMAACTTYAAAQLETVSDDELVHIIKNSDYVVVLFCEL